MIDLIAQSSGEKTADAAIADRKALLIGLEIITDGTNAATVIVYDNASAASGTKLYEGGCVGADLSKTVAFAYPVKCHNGIYVDVSGTGASYIVYYA